MSFQPGTRIASFVITEPLGKGGMGEVYRASDSRLKRDVAIKVLPEELARDAERLARFEREAHLLASLNHPNIAAIYGLEESAGVRCLVLELVEGETLAERLTKGALPADEVLRIAHHLSSALEAAHEKGIIHRDLKPANVKITPDGTVKVLDFGLAKALTERAVPAEDGSLTPTVPLDETRDGTILGTVPYMSPEQARGRPVDRRADIWSMGCVLYECLSGRRLFDGETPTDVLARVVSTEPDLDALPRETPVFLERLLRRCLDRDPRRRLRDAGELRVAVEDFRSDPGSEFRGDEPEPSRGGATARSLLPWVIVVMLGAMVYYLVGWNRPSSGNTGPVSAWSIGLPADGRLSRLGMPGPGGRFDYSRLMAISPDGTRIAYAVQDRQRHVELYLREIHSIESTPVPGTEDARGPFFSPDGRWLGFLSGNAIRKVSLAGGSPQVICRVGRAVSFDASWSPDGETIVFATDDGLWRVPAAGGTPVQLTKPDADRGEAGHHAPRFLDGDHLFFTVSVTPDTHLALLSLGDDTWDVIVRNASQGVTAGDDRILFARSGEILSAPFDTRNHRTTGSAVSVLQGIHTLPGLGGVVLTSFDLSDNGTLAYIPAPATDPEDQLLWVDQNGTETPIIGGPGTWVHPRLSPDGKRISLDIHSPDGMRDVFIVELSRGQIRQLTRTGITWESEWRPDGERIAVLSGAPAGRWSLFLARTDFSGAPELLLGGDHLVPASWLPDGRSLLYTELGGGIWRVWLGGRREEELLLRTSADERHPKLSPDGSWIAYTGNESGRREVFVQSYPELGPKYQVSIDGGGEPVWSPDGRRLYFRAGNRMLVAEIRYQPAFSAGRPRVLFEGEYDAAPLTGHQHYDISQDGERFLMIEHGDPPGPSEVHVVLNWAGTL